jgi:hypothetical protein
MTLTKNTTKSMTREKSIKKSRTRAPVIIREKILLLRTSKITRPRIPGADATDIFGISGNEQSRKENRNA